MIIDTITSFVLGHIFPSMISNDSECMDIHSCRTFLQILKPAVTALVAANFLSVHMNIFCPNLPWYRKAYGAATVFLVALMFPDWVFIWAVRSWIVALRKLEVLEKARASAHAAWEGSEARFETPDACKSRSVPPLQSFY